MRSFLRAIVYFLWLPAMLVPSDMFRLWLVVAGAPAWSVFWLMMWDKDRTR